MPLSSKTETIEEEGQPKEAFSISFTNGAKEQIEDLTQYFKTSDPLEVIKLGISLLQKIKETEQKKIQEVNESK